MATSKRAAVPTKQVVKSLGTEASMRRMRIIAQDPSVVVRQEDGTSRILTAEISVPCEHLGPGPRGYRVHVIDYDASTKTLYSPKVFPPNRDVYLTASDETLLGDPGFHAQNVYAVVMRTLAAFEYALGRRISWAFDSHQLQVAPHAFSIVNAFYSRRDQALLFGYFRDRLGDPVFTCLSHDVIAHETTHALLDGLRERYMDPSSVDQIAFHEGFSDVIALLSVFSLPSVVAVLLNEGATGPLIDAKLTTTEAWRDGKLFSLGEQIGKTMPGSRGDALRRSLLLDPDPKVLEQDEFYEPHRRGEVFVAAMMHAFVNVWQARLSKLGFIEPGKLHIDRVREDGAKAANHLMTMSIRALDYCPPTALTFSQYLTALLDADEELQPDDSTYHYRQVLAESFAAYGIHRRNLGWRVTESTQRKLNYHVTHFEMMKRDPDEVFRFVWENRVALNLDSQAYTKVFSVRPCTRLSPDGFTLHETVAEYLQIANLTAGEVSGIVKRELPDGTDPDEPARLFGGGTLIFDEYGRLKYHARNPIIDPGRQQKRLKDLWDRGYFESGASARFSQLHLSRQLRLPHFASKKETSW